MGVWEKSGFQFSRVLAIILALGCLRHYIWGMKAKKVMPICGCLGCPNIMWDYPDYKSENKANDLKEEDFDNVLQYIGAKRDLKQAYCSENDEPPYQFVLRPINCDLGDVPTWCELPDAPEGLEQYFLHPVYATPHGYHSAPPYNID